MPDFRDEVPYTATKCHIRRRNAGASFFSPFVADERRREALGGMHKTERCFLWDLSAPLTGTGLSFIIRYLTFFTNYGIIIIAINNRVPLKLTNSIFTEPFGFVKIQKCGESAQQFIFYCGELYGES